MAGRYLIIAGRKPSPGTAQSLARHDFQAAISTPDLQLHVNSAQPWTQVSEKSAGIVGNLYARLSAGAHRSPNRPILDRDFEERDLLSSHWGDYVSFRYEGPALTIMRDPSGLLPCFFAVAEGTICLASDVALLVLALGNVPAIDWDQLARLLYINDLPEERTALTGVLELLPGHMLIFEKGHAKVRPFWSPWDHVARGDGPAPAQLEHCVRHCGSACKKNPVSGVIGVQKGTTTPMV